MDNLLKKLDEVEIKVCSLATTFPFHLSQVHGEIGTFR